MTIKYNQFRAKKHKKRGCTINSICHPELVEGVAETPFSAFRQAQHDKVRRDLIYVTASKSCKIML